MIGEGLLARLAQAGIKGAESLFARARVQMDTLRNLWSRAETGPNGGKLCPTCGKEVSVPPGTGQPRDWHADHFPTKNAEIVNDMAETAIQTGVPPTRAEVIQRLTDPANLRLRCPECNIGDNRLGAAGAAGTAGLLGSGQADANSGILGTGITWRDIAEGIVDFLVSPGTANAPEQPRYQGGATGSSGLSGSSGSWGGSANGGFLLYPNKANTNMMQSVYSK